MLSRLRRCNEAGHDVKEVVTTAQVLKLSANDSVSKFATRMP